jgi:lipopolysaccharide/colanic/teichoic acid biosynthesis glycosyltransferase
MGLNENLESLQLPLIVRKPVPVGCAWLARYNSPKRRLSSTAYKRSKRIMDLTMVFLASPVWLMLMGWVALQVKLQNPGQSVLHTEMRAGRGGRRFKMYIFNGKAKDNPLPQLLNVIKGEMSLVGPQATSFTSDIQRLWHTTRLDVPPGLTGLWWIVERQGNGEDERIRLDIAYIDRRCISLDLEILLRTMVALLRKRNSA